MSKTRSEVVSQAAKRLGILAAGQSLSAEDYTTIDDLWPPLTEELAARQVYDVGDPSEVVDAAFLHLADLLALKAAPSFGIGAQVMAMRGVIEAVSVDVLEVISSNSPSKTVLTIERFWG
jgi:hypothetical protein